MISGKEFHVYENGTVTNANETVIVEEGGLENLIKYLEKFEAIFVINDNLRLFIDDKGVVTFANGTILCEGGIEEVEHSFLSHFDQKYAYIKTDNGNVFFYDPVSGNLYNSMGELLLEEGTVNEALAIIDEDYSYFTYDNATYRLYFSGNVTN